MYRLLSHREEHGFQSKHTDAKVDETRRGLNEFRGNRSSTREAGGKPIFLAVLFSSSFWIPLGPRTVYFATNKRNSPAGPPTVSDLALRRVETASLLFEVPGRLATLPGTIGSPLGPPSVRETFVLAPRV